MMSFPRRAIPVGSILRQRSAAIPKSSPIQHSWQRAARRSYASSGKGHSAAPKQSDLPWLIGSVGATALGGWAIGFPAEDKHAHEHHEEGEEHEEHEESDDGDEKSADEGEEKSDSGDESKGEDKSDSDDESKGEDKSDDDNKEAEIEEKPVGGNDKPHDDGPSNPNFNRGASTDAAKDAKTVGKGGDAGGAGDTDGVKGKGATTDGATGDTRKVYEDTKGSKKKRIESDKAYVLAPSDGDDSANAGEPGSQKETSGKQEGLTNTDTKHSTKIHEDPDKSKKPEGTPETSKTKGPVDPSSR